MVVAHCMDVQDDTGEISMTALRCTSCGDVVDAVILQNRLSYGTRQRKYGQRVDDGEIDRPERRPPEGTARDCRR